MAASVTAQIQGVVRKLLSGAARQADGFLDQPARQNQFGELVTNGILTPQQVAAIEGTYFTWSNIQNPVGTTRNTGAALSAAAQTSYSDTYGILVVANTNQVGGPDVILDEFEIAYDAVNTGGVGGFMWHDVDSGQRYASGGNLLTGFNADGAQPTGVLVAAGSLVVSALTNNQRTLGKTVYLNGVGAATPVLNITIKFGGQQTAPASVAIPATTAVDATFFAPAVVIRPQNCYVMHEVQTSRSAAGTGEVFLRAIVR